MLRVIFSLKLFAGTAELCAQWIHMDYVPQNLYTNRKFSPKMLWCQLRNVDKLSSTYLHKSSIIQYSFPVSIFSSDSHNRTETARFLRHGHQALQTSRCTNIDKTQLNILLDSDSILATIHTTHTHGRKFICTKFQWVLWDKSMYLCLPNHALHQCKNIYLSTWHQH